MHKSRFYRGDAAHLHFREIFNIMFLFFIKRYYMRLFTILSGLSAAAVSALFPVQSLANSGVTEGTLRPGTVNGYYSAGFQSKDGGTGSNSGNTLTISGDPTGTDMSSYIVYGGGIGDGSKDGTVYKYAQTTLASGNTLNLQNGGEIFLAIGGEGKGTSSNRVNITNSTATLVLGGNATWNDQVNTHSGNAEGNTVTISGDNTVVKGAKGFLGSGTTTSYLVVGGRARAQQSSLNNAVEISGGSFGQNSGVPFNAIIGGNGENGLIDGNTVTISGGTFYDARIYGGNVTNTNGTGTTSNNKVKINGAAVFNGAGRFFGGSNQQGKILNNTLDITGGINAPGYIAAAGSSANKNGASELSQNTVTVDNANVVLDNVAGAWLGAKATGNKVIFKNGKAKNLYGSLDIKDSGSDSEADANIVEFSGGEVGSI